MRNKKKLTFIATAAALLTAITGSTVNTAGAIAAPTDVVQFSSNNLRACVNLALGNFKLESDVTEEQMLTLTDFTCAYKNVTSLRGLETAKNLTTLQVPGNKISDLSPISALTGLTRIDAWENQISELPSLEKLTNLGLLNLTRNKVENISTLAQNTNLWALFLDQNRVSDLAPVEKLINLKELFFTSNQVTDISPVAKLTNLEWLLLESNQVKDISPVANLSKLRFFLASENQISDISALSGLKDLVSVDIDSNQVGDISPLAGLTKVVNSKLHNQRITDTQVTAGALAPNSIRQLDGRAVPPTVASYCADASCEQLIYPNPGGGIELQWSTEVTIGQGKANFSGTLVRDVGTPVAPTLQGIPHPGKVNVAYEFQFAVTGDPAPSTTVVKGKLPTGLTLREDGMLTGTPEKDGTFTFTVQAANNAEPAATLPVEMTIAAQPVPGKPELRLGSEKLRPGDTQEVTGTGFAAGEKIRLTMYSEPQDLGTVTADNNGSVHAKFRIAESTQAGTHRVVATQGDTDTAEAKFTVYTTKQPGTGKPTDRGVNTSLAKTGETGTPYLIIAVGCALIGVALTVLTRRTRRGHAAPNQ